MSQPATEITASVEERATLLAGQILRNARTSLLLHLRFLESALFQLNPTPANTTIATNGERLYYGFEYLFNAYREENVFLTRAILHTLMHCIFRHPFVAGTIDSELWNFACDVAAEGAIENLNLASVRTRRSGEQAQALRALAKEVPSLTAEKLYRHFLTHPELREDYLNQAPLFYVCDHSLWYSPEEQKDSTDAQNQSAESEQKGDPEGKTDEDPAASADFEDNDMGQDDSADDSGNGDQKDSESDADEGDQNDSDGSDGEGDQSGSGNEENQRESRDNRGPQEPPKLRAPSGISRETRRKLNDMWEDISRHVQVDMETFSQQAGSESVSLAQQLQNLNRERYDYRSFLKRFATKREVMKINDDEFDYIFYTYGLRLYERMPLIEPLEYKEEPRIRDFVIVIDTSGSTSGPLVQTFLQKTYNILMSTETFDSRVNLFIIQCDNQIQDVQRIASPKDFEAYMENMEIRGMGGTDFRPAFSYVDELIREGAFTDLRGLIYFTDGYGVFPSKKPEYDAAFVFIREDYDEPEIPPWAIKLVLDEEEIELV